MKLKYFPLLAALALGACDNPLETAPSASIPADAISTAQDVVAALRGTYDALTYADGSGDGTYSRNLVAYPDLYADNLRASGTYQTDQQVGLRNLTPNNVALRGIWGGAFDGINRANNVIAVIGDPADPAIKDLDPEDAAHYRGEALFLRALHYFNLVRFFGGVPLVTEPTRSGSQDFNLARSSVAEVYGQINRDLLEAVTLLPAGGAPVRATREAARALLAKAYAEQANWQAARSAAEAVIGSDAFELVDDYSDLFLKENTDESIFEVQYTTLDTNGLAFWFFPSSKGGRFGMAPTAGLQAAFEAADARRAFSFAGSGNSAYVTKYPRIGSGDDNVIVLRLSDVYLTRAEAAARMGDLAAAIADVNRVRERAGLAPLAATVDTQSEVLDAVLAERRLEFAFEGHRFFDLRRFGKAKELLGITDNQLLFPIPQREMDVNPELKQNPGY